MNEPDTPGDASADGPAGGRLGGGYPAGESFESGQWRAQRRRELLRFGTAVPMVLTLRPGSTLAASQGCGPDDGNDGNDESGGGTASSTGCRASTPLVFDGARDASERPTLLAGRTASSYAKFWLNRS